MKIFLNRAIYLFSIVFLALVISPLVGKLEAKEFVRSISVPNEQTLNKISNKYELSPQWWTHVVCFKANPLILDQSLNMVFPYKVSEGDHLENLAKRYRTKEFKILLLNQIKNNTLTKNEIIFIPLVPVDSEKTQIKTENETKSEQNTTKAEGKISTKETAETAKSVTLNSKNASKYTTSIKGRAVKKIMNVRATAYGINGNGKWGNKTASGTKVRPGVIAVDPRVIPLGTKVFVTGYKSPDLPKGGFVAVAEDTGGAIKGNKIDIFINKYESQVRYFGIQNVKIHILE